MYMSYANKTDSLDHSEIVERSLEEWSEIFNIERKNYGIKISKYKGNQSLIYIPDFVNRATNFKPTCSVICQKRLFDKFQPEIKINSSIVYLKMPEKYPGDYSKGPKSYIKQQPNKVVQKIISDNDGEAMQGFLNVLGRSIELDFLDYIIQLANGRAEICGMALELKNKLLDKWGYKKMEDGSLCLTSYKGCEEELIIPARIEDAPVSSVDEHAMIPWNPKQKRNQVFIEKTEDARERAKLIKSITIQEGIKSISLLTFKDCNALKRLSIPKSVSSISGGFFLHPGYTIYTPSGSFAEQYVKEKNIMYSDEGVTGTSTKRREGFQNMVADALNGKIDLILTKSVSRFARNTVDSLTTIRELKANGVEVYFEKENIWTFDSKGELLITLMSSLAQEESRSISENVKWGRRKSFADGKVSMSYSAFLGYRRGTDGKPEIDPEQAEIVRRIYRMFVEGKAPNKIADILTKEGVPTPAGKKVWQRHVVESILTNEKYKGDALLQKSSKS